MNDQLISNWLGFGIDLNRPATDGEIINCEQKIRFKFPDDFKALYKRFDGFKNGNMDGEMLCLWPLERIISEYEQSDFIAFCDFMIDAHWIGFSKTKQGIFKYYGNELVFLCDTFTEFLNHWENETMEYL